MIDNGQVIAEGTSDELKDRIGGERLEVRIGEGCAVEDAIGALAPIAADTPTADRRTVRAPIQKSAGTIAEAVRRLDDASVWIDDIAIRRPTLDDVFLTLTGHAAEEPAEEEQEAGEAVA